MGAEHANFDRISSRLRLQGVLETKTALRIGSGGAGAFDGSDLPVLRDADGYPLIPGSSLKGAIRSTVEALVRGHNPASKASIWACDPLSEEKATGGYTCGRYKSGESTRAEAQAQPHCTVCQLFGSRVLASHVRFTDALLTDGQSLRAEGRIPIEVRDGVAIDRDLCTAFGGQKYNFEVVPPGTSFDLELFVENPEPALMGLLVMGLEQVSEGFTAIGGFTSRGLGRVTIRWSSLMEYEAGALLEGRPPTVDAGEALEKRFAAWRGTLAVEVKGGHHVSA